MSSQMARPVAAEVMGTSGWVQAHEAVLGVARERAGLERREGVCLLRALREKVHRHLGYGAFPEYTDRHLGYSHRTTEDKLRTAAALEHLPELAQAQRQGTLNASAVRELARVATAETEAAWIEAATGLRVREVERLVAGRVPGDRPTDVARPEVVKHILRFEVRAETLAAMRSALRRVAERSGQRLGDDDALLLIARTILDLPPASAADPAAASAQPASASAPAAAGAIDPSAAGGARYQISILECPSCRRAFTPAGADLLEIDAATLDAAHCDARLIPTGHGRGDPPGGTHAGLDAPDAMPEHAEARPTRMAQSIPPAVRRHVLSRDHRTCQIPGCRNFLDIEIHHIQPRAEGGSNRAENLPCICSMHHRAIHRGQIHVSGSAEALVVTHADGTPYGKGVSASRSDVSEKVFRGLRWLGFKEREARAAIQAALLEPGDGSVATDDAALLRRALAHLG